MREREEDRPEQEERLKPHTLSQTVRGLAEKEACRSEIAMRRWEARAGTVERR